MKTLVFHTIQTADHNWKLPHSDPSQPPLLALVASLQDDDLGEIDRMTRMVRLDDGMRVDKSTTDREGLTTEMMEDRGLHLEDVMIEFGDMLKGCEWKAAYGCDHHSKIVAIAAELADVSLPIVAQMDLMKRSTIPCRLPSRTAGTFKQPKLIEAYEHFAGKPLSLSFDGDAQSILNQHLEARLVVYRGLRKYESDELLKAAGAQSYGQTPNGPRGEWE
jgi:hypothetical protein